MRTGNPVCPHKAPFPEPAHTLPRLARTVTRQQVAEERPGPGPLLPLTEVREPLSFQSLRALPRPLCLPFFQIRVKPS